MVELGLGANANQANLNQGLARSVKVVAGARNRLDLQLRELLKTAIIWEESASGLRTSAFGP